MPPPPPPRLPTSGPNTTSAPPTSNGSVGSPPSPPARPSNGLETNGSQATSPLVRPIGAPPTRPPVSTASSSQWPASSNGDDGSDLTSSQYAPSSRVFAPPTSTGSEGSRVAPPERIPNNRKPGVAPAVPTSRPNTPRDTDGLANSYSASFSAPSRPPPTAGTLSSNPSFTRPPGPPAPPSGPPSSKTGSPPPIRPPPATSLTAPPLAADDLGASNPSRSGTFAPPPSTRPQVPTSGSSNGTAPGHLQLSGDEGVSNNASAVFVAPNSSFSNNQQGVNYYGNSSFSGSEGRNGSPTTNTSYGAPPAARPSVPPPPPASAHRTTPTTMNIPASPTSKQPPPPSQAPIIVQRAPSVAFAEHNNSTTYYDSNTAPSQTTAEHQKSLNITRPNRNGYEEALKSAAVQTRSQEVSDAPALPLYSPSRSNFSTMRPIERRHLQEALSAPPKCDKLFTYEEPLVYGASNREILAWNPSAQPTPAELRAMDKSQPAPVGTTLYDGDYAPGGSHSVGYHLSANRNRDMDNALKVAAEPYEGRNELVKQLREYERRKETAEGLRSESSQLYQSGYYQPQPTQQQQHQLPAATAASYARPSMPQQHQEYQFQQYQPQSGNDSLVTPSYYDSVYNGGDVPASRGGMNTRYTTETNFVTPSGAANDGYVGSPAPRAAASTRPAYNQQPVEKIIRSYPSDWRVGSGSTVHSVSRTPY